VVCSAINLGFIYSNPSSLVKCGLLFLKLKAIRQELVDLGELTVEAWTNWSKR